MSGISGDKIILCQPDNLKGCSLCCGLFNFRDFSPDCLTEFLNKGRERESEHKVFEEYNSPHKLRSRFSHICPYQGFLSENKPGCLVHPLYAGTDGRDRSLFAHKICENFFCPAHSVLTAEEKIFLIENITNWYLYSVAIADPESYSFIYNFVKTDYYEDCANEFFISLVREGLRFHSMNLSLYEGEIFYYSIPEYDLNKKNYSLRYRKDFMESVVSGISNPASSFS
jgi:hypothetical protein